MVFRKVLTLFPKMLRAMTKYWCKFHGNLMYGKKMRYEVVNSKNIIERYFKNSKHTRTLKYPTTALVKGNGGSTCE